MIERIFLDWDQPFLAQAVDWLLLRYRTKHECQMQGHFLVLPGQRASRRCLELLLEKTEAEKLSLVPPKIVSVGLLPEIIATISQESASEMQCIFAWIQALKSIKPKVLRALIPLPPEPEENHSWLLLAERIHGIYEEISGASLSFEDVIARIRSSSHFSDEARWEVLALVFERYANELESIGLSDRHMLRKYSQVEKSFQLSGDLVLLSTVDLNELSKSMLRKLNSPVFSLIHAPQDYSKSFDDIGCLITEKWLELEIKVRDEEFEIVEKASETGALLISKLKEFNEEISTSDLRVGLCDAALSPYIIQSLIEEGIPVRDAGGVKASNLSIYAFLKTLRDFLVLRRFFLFGSLLRLPEVEVWLRQYFEAQGLNEFAELDYLSILDEYQSSHLQAQIGDDIFGQGELAELVRKIYQALKILIGDFFGSAKSLNSWAESLISLLLRLYENCKAKDASRSSNAFLGQLEAIHGIALEFFTLQGNAMAIDGAEALSLFIHRLAFKEIHTDCNLPAVELLGWLELRLDDAPIVFVTGFNETFVPESLNADPFLPDSLRSLLGLLDNDKRYSRDAYALASMLRSKKKLFLIGSKQSPQGNHLLPSRLLYTGSPEELTKRIAKIFTNVEKKNIPKPRTETEGQYFSMPLPPVKMPKALESVSVSGFGDYLQCPYRFYLNHVLRLGVLDDNMLEMDPLYFGSLAHEVLADFGRSSLKTSSNADEISDFLCSSLSGRCLKIFGWKVLPAVLVQIEQLKERLIAFAKWQAKWREEGWEIKDIELAFKDKDFILSDSGNILKVTGRIDRIDYHPDQKRFMVFDYKVGDLKSYPENVHRKRKEWVDLQLPIYHYYLCKIRGVKNPLDLGLISLCADLEQVGAEIAAWSEEDLQSAYLCMKEVAKKILSQEFWPPSEKKYQHDDFKILCGFGQVKSPLTEGTLVLKDAFSKDLGGRLV
ncbi:MAG: hypothetical protein GYA55_09280 [SAR324 cluster bacterium]|uniref:PD-(D/E)XK endonuclease-like domain-containing protein n=1 Tax=SAR324 cluster bacterium TaxID=2024889 RepID=A0A7X9ILU1_9DELT|nr:hypothetical protein [SAR324 cluster bacterium]